MIILIPLFLPCVFAPAQASSVDGNIEVNGDSTAASFTFIGSKNVRLDYPADSMMATVLDGQNKRYEIGPMTANTFDDATIDPNGGMTKVVEVLNETIALNSGGQVHVENATLRYTATIRGEPTHALIAYRLQLDITVKGLVIYNSSNTNDTYVNLGWREFELDDPLYIATDDYGEFDVNHPAGLLQMAHPSIAEKLYSLPEANKILAQEPILNFKDFALPIEKWHLEYNNGSDQSLSDKQPAIVYSIGQPDYEEAFPVGREETATVNLEGYDVKVTAETPVPLGQIKIVGVPLGGLRIIPEFSGSFVIVIAAGSVCIAIITSLNSKAWKTSA